MCVINTDEWSTILDLQYKIQMTKILFKKPSHYHQDFLYASIQQMF
jgi:hypothetical protein